MDADGPRRLGHVHSIVHDEHGPGRPGAGTDPDREGEGLAGGERLGSELEPADAGFEHSVDQGEGVAPAGQGGVDDDVEVERREIREALRNAAQNSVSRNVVA
jgi:hypothetical protein